MNRQDYDRVVAAVAEETNLSLESIPGLLARQGIVPESTPVLKDFSETMLVFGMASDMRPHQTICNEHGWNDPVGIEHVAMAVTKQRRFVLLQCEEDGQSQVQLYVYDLLDPGRFWMIELPVVLASSGQ